MLLSSRHCGLGQARGSGWGRGGLRAARARNTGCYPSRTGRRSESRGGDPNQGTAIRVTRRRSESSGGDPSRTGTAGEARMGTGPGPVIRVRSECVDAAREAVEAHGAGVCGYRRGGVRCPPGAGHGRCPRIFGSPALGVPAVTGSACGDWECRRCGRGADVERTRLRSESWGAGNGVTQIAAP